MLAIERQKIIMHLISEYGQVTVRDLSTQLDVSAATVRNDLTKLEQEKKIQKTHGGATIPVEEPFSILYTAPSPSYYRFETRQARNIEEKQRIVNAAVDSIQDGQCILLDASSTALELAKLLGQFSRLTVVTNGIDTMLALKNMPNIVVIFIGGIVSKFSSSIEGLLGADLLNHINPDIAFVSAHGISLREGVTDFNVYEVELKRTMVAHSKKVVAMLDYTKFGTVSTASFCRTQDIDLLLTDEKTPQDVIDLYRDNGLDVVVCRDRQ